MKIKAFIHIFIEITLFFMIDYLIDFIIRLKKLIVNSAIHIYKQIKFIIQI